MNRREFFTTTGAIAATSLLPSISIADEIPRIFRSRASSASISPAGGQSWSARIRGSMCMAIARLIAWCGSTRTPARGHGNCRAEESELSATAR